MKNFSLAVLLMVGACLHACSQAQDGAEHFQKFPKERQITLDTFLKMDNASAYKLYPTRNNLFVVLSRGVQSHFFNRYSLTDKKLTGEYVSGGGGKGKALNALSSNILDGGERFWLQDVSSQKIMIGTFPGKKGDTVTTKEFALPGFYYSSALLDGEKLLISGAEDSSRAKLQVLDIASGKVEKNIGVFPPSPGFTVNQLRSIYQSFLVVKPTQDRAALIARFTDQVEFFDLKTGAAKMVKGPDNLEPKFKKDVQQGKQIAYRAPGNHFAFSDFAATNQYIFLLFSGNEEDGPHKWGGQHVYVYDWYGKPVEKISFEPYVTCIGISADGREMFAYSPETRYIYRSKL